MDNFIQNIIISSNSLIFKKELLSIPKICTINRHSALLPSYGGLLPVFQSFIHGEKFTGVSIHYMNNKIENNHDLKKYGWQKEHLPNQTGSNNSYHPKKYNNGVKKKYKSWNK